MLVTLSPLPPEPHTSRGAQTPLPGWEPVCRGQASFHQEAITAHWSATASQPGAWQYPSQQHSCLHRWDLPINSHGKSLCAQERGKVSRGHHSGPGSHCTARQWLCPCSQGKGGIAWPGAEPVSPWRVLGAALQSPGSA